MINPLNEQDRSRLARSCEYSFTELDKFAKMRANTIKAYLGVSPWSPEWDLMGLDTRYRDSLPKGNLLQLSALAMQIHLAYGDPQWLATTDDPNKIGTAEQIEPALNRMGTLLDVGETARQIAADSYFGYGIMKVGIGSLPAAARRATGLDIGPCIWRVSQKHFIYDITASDWDNVAFAGDLYTLPLNEAQERWPQHADRLQEMTDSERLDARIVMPRPSTFYSAEPMVLLFDMHIPGSNLIATWPIQNHSMQSISETPLSVREWEGHWSGVYQVLTHLYTPDELVPVAQSESTKALHFLFNDLLELTSEQARKARVNPLYEAGAERDVKRIWDSADRVPVPVINKDRFGAFEVPGPTQSQTAYMNGIMGLFKEMSLNLDDQLGLAPTAETATGQGLIRQQTNALIAEARRKFFRVMALAGYKLGDLLMKSPDLELPLTRPLRPGSRIRVDVSWVKPSRQPRNGQIDDVAIKLDPFSTPYRTPEQKLQSIVAISQGVILPTMEAEAMGFPISSKNMLEIAAKYSGNPELRDVYEPADPLYTHIKQQSRFTAKRPGTGEYIRRNVSTRTNDGAVTQAFTQVNDSPANVTENQQ